MTSTPSHSHSHHSSSQHLPQSFFARPAEQVAPELIGCLLVKRLAPQLPDPGTNAEGMLQAL